MNTESLYKEDDFICPGLENARPGAGEIKYGRLAYEDGWYMYQAAKLNRQERHSRFLRIPLNCNEETRAFGGKLSWNKNGFMANEYSFQHMKEMEHLAHLKYSKDMFQTIFHCLETAKSDSSEKNAVPIMLCVEGAFSILCSLIVMMTLFSEYKKERMLVHGILSNISDILSSYILDALSFGVKIISLADPAASIRLMGTKYYKELSGEYMIQLLKKLEPYMSHACIHLCGKSSMDLKRSHLISFSKTSYQGEYGQCVLDAVNDQSVHIIGNGCMNCEDYWTDGLYLVHFF